MRNALKVAAENSHAADKQCRRWLYLRFAAGYSAWRGAAATRRHLAAKAEEAAELHRHTLAARCLAALQHHTARMAAKRQLRSTAEGFAAFSLMVHGLDAWRCCVAGKARMQRRLEAAVLHWAARLCCSALAAWHTYTRSRLLRQRLGQLMSARLRRGRLALWLAAWLGLMRRLRELRRAAEVTIQQALWGSREQVAKMCLRAWLAGTRRAAQLRASCSRAARVRCLSLLAAAWHAWCQRLALKRHLAQLHLAVHTLQRRLMLNCAVRRWQAVLHASQAADASMCYRALHLPRTFSAWMRHTQHKAQLIAQTEVCQALLARSRRRQALAFWRGWAGRKAAARERRHQICAAWLARSKQHILASWRQAVQRKTSRRMQRQRAEAHKGARVVRAALLLWWRIAGARRMSTHWRCCFLLCGAFSSWRQRTQQAVSKAARWQLTVRHRYLSHLHMALAAWREAHLRQRQKQERLQVMQHHWQLMLLRSSWKLWAGGCLSGAARATMLERAATHHSRRLMYLCVRQWRGPFLLASRQRRLLLRTADAQHVAAVLRRALGAWQAWCDLQSCDRRQQAQAAAQLLRCAQLHSLLAAWQQQHVEMLEQNAQVLAWVHVALFSPACSGGIH
jgi:hypothetical protein